MKKIYLLLMLACLAAATAQAQKVLKKFLFPNGAEKIVVIQFAGCISHHEVMGFATANHYKIGTMSELQFLDAQYKNDPEHFPLPPHSKTIIFTGNTNKKTSADVIFHPEQYMYVDCFWMSNYPGIVHDLFIEYCLESRMLQLRQMEDMLFCFKK